MNKKGKVSVSKKLKPKFTIEKELVGENVRVWIHLPGRGREAHEYEHCLIMRHGENRTCPIGGGLCNYGLTEISPPQQCPMRSGKFKNVVTMKFSIVDRKEEETE